MIAHLCVFVHINILLRHEKYRRRSKCDKFVILLVYFEYCTEDNTLYAEYKQKAVLISLQQTYKISVKYFSEETY